MEQQIYLALTIGPIYNTFNQAKRTRSVWAASYFFSWFIRQVIVKSHEADFIILMPHHPGSPYKSKFGSGLYADRIYYEPSPKANTDLQSIVDLVIKVIAADIEKDKPEVEEYLKQYLNIQIVEKEISDKNDVLKTLNRLLDQRELMQHYPFENETNYLLDYLDNKLSDNSILSKDAFGEGRGLRFRSIPEIATTTLTRLIPNQYQSLIHESYKATRKNIDLELIDTIGTDNRWGDLNKILRPHHKYYGVLYADGDNIGSLLNKVAGDFDAMREFSKQLFLFGQKAEIVIADYGGNGIYLGGEDVLAFLPMACINKDRTEIQTIFDIIAQLDQCFTDTIGRYSKSKGVDAPTLSYGIQISYVKYPLKEAMNQAHILLDTVKEGTLENKVDKRFPKKNAVGLCFQKHSGQQMQCFYEKGHSSSWEKIQEMMKSYCQDAHQKGDEEGNEELLSGVIHRLKDNLFFETLCRAAEKGNLHYFFDNFFNEPIHREGNPGYDFLQTVRSLVEKVFDDYKYRQDYQVCKDILFTTLRYLHFINSDKE